MCVVDIKSPSWVVSRRGDHSGCGLVIAWRGETTHSGVDINNTHLSLINPLNFPRQVLALRYCRCLRRCVSLCVSLCVDYLLVRAITQNPFKLRSSNLDQMCKTIWWRSLSFCGAIDLDLLGQIWGQNPNLPHFEFVRTITHQAFKLGSPNLDQMCKMHGLRSLYFCRTIGLDLQCQIQLKSQNLHSHHDLKYTPDCFMVSIICTYLHT